MGGSNRLLSVDELAAYLGVPNGHRQIRTIRREETKEIIAGMRRKGLSASRITQAHLVINAVFNEAVRNKKLAESPCTDIPVPDVVHAADFVFPEDDELEALAAGLPADWWPLNAGVPWRAFARKVHGTSQFGGEHLTEPVGDEPPDG
ncbi:hypothetical protein EAS64_24505 [Trebonia kvetii]|uniref:Uncharacterized protein n=1 Tax=Trebonia kvetii TaxID=2480626 RepID=A0A6P2BX73_9ACTN|nr:hypothetical protein [Trebonia kvetii]TVZ03538.1 hypothetical protein EAS64_24505 [Trebonia kvetii]